MACFCALGNFLRQHISAKFWQHIGEKKLEQHFRASYFIALLKVDYPFPGYLPLPEKLEPVYPLSQLMKTESQREELSQWLSQQQSEVAASMVCEICEDHATGLHYGILTCEG